MQSHIIKHCSFRPNRWYFIKMVVRETRSLSPLKLELEYLINEQNDSAFAHNYLLNLQLFNVQHLSCEAMCGDEIHI